MARWRLVRRVCVSALPSLLLACGSGGAGTAATPSNDASVAPAGSDASKDGTVRLDGSGSSDAAVQPSDAVLSADVAADAPAPAPDAASAACPTPMPPQAGGTTYYVASAGGSDANTGLAGKPFATLQHAADVVGPGDTVIVEDGTYSATGEAVLSVVHGGTSSSFVVFRARNRWGAKIDGNNQVALGVSFASGVGYVRIEGFEITNITGTAGAGGINCNDGGNDVQIVGNHIHDIGRSCTDSDYGLDAVFIRQPNITIEQNLIHHIGRLGPGENGCSPANGYYQNHDHGVYVDGATPGASHALLRNNVFHDCNHGWAVQLYPGTLTDVRILNNTFYGPNPWRAGHIVIYGITFSSSVIANNVFLDPTGSAISVGGGPTVSSTTVSHNVTNRGSMLDVGNQTGITLTANATNQDPKLVAPASGQFAAADGSPVIDTGETRTDVTNDFDGNCRPQGSGYDVGAFER